jgi:hypothetical protein
MTWRDVQNNVVGHSGLRGGMFGMTGSIIKDYVVYSETQSLCL